MLTYANLNMENLELKLEKSDAYPHIYIDEILKLLCRLAL